MMLLYHNHENVSYANLICINVLKILKKKQADDEKTNEL